MRVTIEKEAPVADVMRDVDPEIFRDRSVAHERGAILLWGERGVRSAVLNHNRLKREPLRHGFNGLLSQDGGGAGDNRRDEGARIPFKPVHPTVVASAAHGADASRPLIALPPSWTGDGLAGGGVVVKSKAIMARAGGDGA